MMDLDAKQISAIGRRAGFWAALTFMGTLFAVALAVGACRLAWEGIEQQAVSNRAAQAATEAAVVRPAFLAQAKVCKADILAEHEAATAGKKRFADAKGQAVACVDALENSAKTNAEVGISSPLMGARIGYDSCVEESYEYSWAPKAATCEQYFGLLKSSLEKIP